MGEFDNLMNELDRLSYEYYTKETFTDSDKSGAPSIAGLDNETVILAVVLAPLLLFIIYLIIDAAIGFEKIKKYLNIRKGGNKTPKNKMIIAGLVFLLFRGLYDIGTAIYFDKAIQMLLAAIPIACFSLAFIDKHKEKFLPLSGIYLVLLGLANTVILVAMTVSKAGVSKGLAFLASLPLQVLPGMIVSKILPIGFGIYFLIHWHEQKARSVQENKDEAPAE